MFVRTEPDKSGYLLHVIGDIQNGMKYEEKKTSRDPEKSKTFQKLTKVGEVATGDLGL